VVKIHASRRQQRARAGVSRILRERGKSTGAGASSREQGASGATSSRVSLALEGIQGGGSSERI
jgi:hypothetical protein